MFKYFAKLQRNHQIIFAIIVGTSFMLYWRGVTGIADLLLFPDDPLFRYITCFIVGITVLLASDYAIKKLA